MGKISWCSSSISGAGREKRISGPVIVQFIVDKDGNLLEIQAISGSEELRAEAERLMMESGTWLPARQNGYIVKA